MHAENYSLPLATQMDASRSNAYWLGRTNATLAALYSLSQHLPGINQLLEKSFIDISAGFLEMAEDVRHLSESLPMPTAAQAEGLVRMQQQIRTLVMAMQFQDRVSQHLVITTKVIDAMIHSQQLFANELALSHKRSDSPANALDAEFAKDLLNLLNLGELRHSYADYLLQHGLIQSAETLGMGAGGPPSSAATDDGDVELF